MNRLFASAALFGALLASPVAPAGAAEREPTQREPYGIGLEGFAYPYPVHMLPLVNDGDPVRMAYMDIVPAQSNGRTVVLLHAAIFHRVTGRLSSRR